MAMARLAGILKPTSNTPTVNMGVKARRLSNPRFSDGKILEV